MERGRGAMAAPARPPCRQPRRPGRAGPRPEIARGARARYGPRMPRAKTLDEAYKLLDPRPLVFTDDGPPQGAAAASNQDFYIEPPAQKKGNRNLPSPVENIRQRLLDGTPD